LIGWLAGWLAGWLIDMNNNTVTANEQAAKQQTSNQRETRAIIGK